MSQHTEPVPLEFDLPEHLCRGSLTIGDVHWLCYAGFIADGVRFELFNGDVLEMSFRELSHETVRCGLYLHWARNSGRDLKLASDTPLHLDSQFVFEPDLIVFPAALRLGDVKGFSVILVVEIADYTSLWEKEKARHYAEHGVREYWIIEPGRDLQTTIHLEPSANGYAQKLVLPKTELLTPSLAPALAVRLGDLAPY